MNYPLISEYIESIKSAEDNFATMPNLRPVYDNNGEIVMNSGNFAVVFKMKEEDSGKLYAVKCFLKEQEGRKEAYGKITEELKDVHSQYITEFKYIESELFVDSRNSDFQDFPVVLMDWIDGKDLYSYISENFGNQEETRKISYNFGQMAQWLLLQPFAHGDLKPDNILVKEDGQLVLIDYDGMYVPAMKGETERELGSPNFRHPSRASMDFDEHIDDFPLAVISLCLRAIAIYPELFKLYSNGNNMLFMDVDYLNISDSELYKKLTSLLYDNELSKLLSLFNLVLINAQTKDMMQNLVAPAKNALDTYSKMYEDAHRICNEGDSTDCDQEKALEMFKKAAEHGNLKAMDCFACCFKNGYGCNRSKDLSNSFIWYKKAADLNYLNAQVNLGYCYLYGNGVGKDISKALYWYQKAAEQNDTKAQVILGLLYEYGESVDKDETKAVYWYQKAAEQNYAGAQCYLGRCYYNGIGVEKDFTKVVYWYQKAAEQNNSNAQYFMGVLYDNGIRVEKDFAKAVYWYQKAADQNYSDAQYKLGCCYDEGKGVEKDIVKAVYWYQKAADQNNPDAQYELGCCYLYGEGVEKDYAKAVYWYQKAADQNNSDAQYNLGCCYLYGKGVEKDFSKTFYWYKRAANLNHPAALYKLGLCYECGEGVEKDLNKALELYSNAEDKKYAQAKEARQRVETLLGIQLPF